MNPSTRAYTACRFRAPQQDVANNELDRNGSDHLFRLLDLTLAQRISGVCARRNVRNILTAITHRQPEISIRDHEGHTPHSNSVRSPALRTGARKSVFVTCKASGERFKKALRELPWFILLTVMLLLPQSPFGAAFGQSAEGASSLMLSDPYLQADALRKEGKNREASAAAAAKVYGDISLIGVNRKSQLFGDLNAVEILDPLGWADSLSKEGKYQEALSVLNDVLRKDPKSGGAYARRSGVLANLSQFEGGAADGELGIKLSTTSRDKSRAAYNRCLNLTYLDKKAEALKACNLSLSFDPKYSWAHFGLGKLYYFLGMWKESGAALDRSLELNPKAPAAMAYRAEVHFLSGEIEKGMAQAQRAVELGPKDPRSFRARAIGFQLSNRFEEMLADATRAVELGPNVPLAHLMRGKALGLLGRYDEALAEYTVEPDRKAVEPYLAGVHFELYGSRIYNPGACSSEIQTPLNYNSDAFEECKKKIMQTLQELAEPAPATKPTKRTVPGLPKRPTRK